MLEALHHALIDTAKILPFLFLTYLVLEYIEHKAAEKTARLAAGAGKFAPAVGGLLGAIPQCGFSASAAGLYSGGIITLGTLIAIFLSTSDEMLPIMLSSDMKLSRILSIVAIKVALGIFTGYLIDLFLRFTKKVPQKTSVSDICEDENCRCGEKGIFRSALFHTLQVGAFLFLLTFLITWLIHGVGEEKLSELAASAGIFGPLVAGLVGLVPNCASSIILTTLFLEGVIGTGALMAGLLAGSGVGLLVLFRINKNLKENLIITAIVYLSGVTFGLLFDLFGIAL